MNQPSISAGVPGVTKRGRGEGFKPEGWGINIQPLRPPPWVHLLLYKKGLILLCENVITGIIIPAWNAPGYPRLINGWIREKGRTEKGLTDFLYSFACSQTMLSGSLLGWKGCKKYQKTTAEYRPGVLFPL